MAKLGERSETLKRYGMTETSLRALYTDRDPADATWLAEHELKAHIAWAQERHEFILAEIAERHPGLKIVKPTIGPPIVSHRGRTSDNSVFGEQRG
jgi:hypothetical protein